MLSAEPKSEADNTYLDLDYLGYHTKPNLIIVLWYIILKKIKTNRRKEPELILWLEIMHCAGSLQNSQLVLADN